jgi:hypothetical protein
LQGKNIKKWKRKRWKCKRKRKKGERKRKKGEEKEKREVKGKIKSKIG